MLQTREWQQAHHYVYVSLWRGGLSCIGLYLYACSLRPAHVGSVQAGGWRVSSRVSWWCFCRLPGVHTQVCEVVLREGLEFTPPEVQDTGLSPKCVPQVCCVSSLQEVEPQLGGVGRVHGHACHTAMELVARGEPGAPHIC